MKSRTHSRLHSPIVLRVAALNRYILNKRGKAKKAVQYNYIDDLLKQCYLLFKYALRQLSGKDYIKRTIELCDEIQTTTYLIATLGGFTNEEALATNQKKHYMQPADNGVKFCGYVIKCDRIYISNRVVRATRRLIEIYAYKTSARSEAELARRLNSYLGIMSHTRSYNIQRRIIAEVLRLHKTLYFFRRDSHFVCAQYPEYTPRFEAIQNILKFKNETYRLQARFHHSRMRRRACRRMEINANI